MNIKNLFLASMAAFVLGGCAHSISITPDLAALPPAPADQKIQKNVGYYFSDELVAKEVTTPGGGGDKVTYKPYKDIEVGFYKTLMDVFASATKLKSADDKEAIAKNKIDYIVTTELVTNSSSSGTFTWPPTDFSVEMTCNFSDLDGKLLFSRKVMGQGHAEFSEFKKNFSLSGQLATANALTRMQKDLLAAPELHK